MSSAILYAAIVAIWACVLVPRWLRQRSAPARQAEMTEDLSAVPELDERPAKTLSEAGGPSAADGPDPSRAQPAAAEPAAAPAAAQPAPARPPAAQPPPAQPAAAELGRGQPGPAHPSTGSPFPAEPAAPLTLHAPAATPHAGNHAQLLRARRSMLATLVLIAVAATGLSVLHLVPRWLAIPPVLMLAGFIVLLREAARSDAERSRQRALAARASSRAVADQKADGHAQLVTASSPMAAPAPPVYVSDATLPPLPAVSAEPQEWHAQVIDISARRGDQLYDQYADAAERAVGD